MQPITVRQRLMQYLTDEAKQPFRFDSATRKQKLVEIAQSTDSNVANELAYLSKAGLISETKGRYAATPLGIKTYEEDPMLSTLKNGFMIGGSESPKNPLDNIIDWDYIRSNRLCWAARTVEFKEGFDYRKLLPIVIMYLDKVGYPLPPKGDDKPDPNSTYETELELLTDYMVKLVEV